MSTTGSDTFATATPLTVGTASDPTPNASLTAETGEPYPGEGRTAWWKITPETSGWLRLHTHDSTPGSDTTLTVYTGASVDSLTEIAASDDAGQTYDDLTSRVVFEATAGTAYYVQVDTYDTEASDYVLTSQAVTLSTIRPTSTVGGQIFVDTFGITYEEPSPAVGAPPQWGDESDGTYIDLSNDSLTTTQQAHAVFAAVPDAVDIVGLRVRTMHLSPSGTGSFRTSLGDVDEPGIPGGLGPAVSGSGGPAWRTSQDLLEISGQRFVPWLPALLAGRLYVVVEPTRESGSVNAIRVYEAELTVAVATAVAPTPILRVHPRSDGRGLSSARRVWPPSKVSQDNRWLPYGGGYR